MKYLFIIIFIFYCNPFTKEQPNKKFYSLEADLNKISKNSKPKFQKLKINKFKISPEYEGKEFVYRKGLIFETDFYNQFLISPSTNITEQIIQVFNKSGFSGILTNRVVVSDSNYILEGNINSVYVDFSKNKPISILEIEIYLTDSIKDETIFRKNYIQKKELKEKNTDQFVYSWNQSLTEISTEILKDINLIEFK